MEPGSDDAATTESGVDPRLADALERVAHGAVVSVPSILTQRLLTVAFTAVLTNGFSAAAYGLFVLARRIQRYLRRIASGYSRGLSRYLPSTDSGTERDVLATTAAALLLGVAGAFGLGLYLAAPAVADVAGKGARFGRFLRVFAVGLPATVWLFTVAELLRALEEVGPLNLVQRIGFPVAQLAVGVVATVVFHDLFVAAVGVMAAMGLVGVVAAAWAVRTHDLRPRLRAPDASALRRQYVRFTTPLFVGGIATATQRLGFYPLIALLLSGTAGGVFAVGVLLAGLVRLPLMGINQFVPPVVAALHDADHREPLARLYHVTSRLVLTGVLAVAVPLVVYRWSVLSLFGPTFVAHAALLPWFVLAQVLACAAGSVGIMLTMTDHQRALLVVNVALTAVLVVTTVPLTATFGLSGLVAGYFLMLALNNGLEVAVLYRVEGLQPFTRAHLRPVAAAVPLAAVALAARELAVPRAAVVGTVLGLLAYAAVLRWFGVDPVERRLVGSLVDRYRTALPA